MPAEIGKRPAERQKLTMVSVSTKRPRGRRLFVVVRYWSIELVSFGGYQWVEHKQFVEIVPPPDAGTCGGFWSGLTGRGPTAEELAKGIQDALK
jgi:hypothetical protein